ncbi:MAG: hypothetical protein AAF541_16795 [Pseudomonadota bacterium]
MSTRQTRHDWGKHRYFLAALMRTLRRAIGLRFNYVFVGSDRPDFLDANQGALAQGYTSQLCTKSDLVDHASPDNMLTEAFLAEVNWEIHDCAAAFCEGKLVAYKFAARKRVRLTEQLDVIVPTGFRTTYKAWTHPDHRQNNLSYHLSHVLHKHCHAKKFRERTIFYIESTNYASLLHGYLDPRQASLRMGYFGWISVFGRQIPFNSRWAKRIGYYALRKDDTRTRYYAN